MAQISTSLSYESPLVHSSTFETTRSYCLSAFAVRDGMVPHEYYYAVGKLRIWARKKSVHPPERRIRFIGASTILTRQKIFHHLVHEAFPLL
jgi:hypothetical protein